MNIGIHRVKSVKTLAWTYNDDGDAKAFYTRRIIVTGGDGSETEITLFSYDSPTSLTIHDVDAESKSEEEVRQ